MSDQESTQAVINGTVYRLADDLALLIAVAVERHPEALRTALGKVFDLTATDHYSRHAAAVARGASKIAFETAAEVRDLSERANQALMEVQKWLDGLHERMDRLRLEALEERIELLEAQLQPEER